MSFKSTLDLSDHFNRLQFAYEKCRVNQYVEGHYAKYEDGKLSVCGIGWALKAAGWTDEDLGAVRTAIPCAIKSLTNYKNPHKALEEYGFTKEESRKRRYCPQPDCTFSGGLQSVLEHINECHQIPIPNIGKLIPLLRKKKEIPPTLADTWRFFKQDIKKLIKP